MDEKPEEISEAERRVNRQRQFEERALKGEEGIWWRLFIILSRFLNNRSPAEFIVVFILFMVAMFFLDITLEHLGISQPYEERCPNSIGLSNVKESC